MKLLELIDPSSIVPELEATDRNGAIRELVHVLATGGLVSEAEADGIARSIIVRERRGTTGLGNGIAVPHTKYDGLGRVMGVVGRSSRGIDFASLDRAPVFGVILIVSPTDQTEDHLRAMDLVFRHLHREKFRRFLRQSDTREKIYELMREADDKLLA